MSLMLHTHCRCSLPEVVHGLHCQMGEICHPFYFITGRPFDFQLLITEWINETKKQQLESTKVRLLRL